ncbi:MAG: STAS-like domain-containing protein [Phormidesmis sp. CAN_BIN36]|nr:STAS-like domain-containing protein [Phormidesmis sp. CAN_BIN36]
MVYKIHEITGEFATDAENGQALYDLIYPELRAENSVKLDFSGVNVFASAFFNFAIGQLLSDITQDELNRLLQVENLNDDGRFTLKRSIDNAKEYYSDAGYRKAVDSVIEEYAASF